MSIASLTGTKMIRNTQPGPTVLTWGTGNNDYLMWEGAGDPNGNDILEVSDDVLAMPQMKKNMKRGIFEVVESQEEIDAAETAQREHWDKTRQGAQSSTQTILDKPQDKSFDVLTCIGPSDNSQSGKTCDAVVTMKAADLAERPPLCDRHKNLASQFVPTDDMDDQGKKSTTWSRVTLSRR